MLEIRKRSVKGPFVNLQLPSSDRKDQFCFKHIREPPRSSERLATGADGKQITDDRGQTAKPLGLAPTPSTAIPFAETGCASSSQCQFDRKRQNRSPRTHVLGVVAASLEDRAPAPNPRALARNHDPQTDVSSEAPAARRRLSSNPCVLRRTRFASNPCVCVELLRLRPTRRREGQDDPSSVSRTPNGGARRDRTDDLMLAKHALSQLSYGPVEEQNTDARRHRSVSRHPSSDSGGPGRTRTSDLTLIKRAL